MNVPEKALASGSCPPSSPHNPITKDISLALHKKRIPLPTSYLTYLTSAHCFMEENLPSTSPRLALMLRKLITLIHSSLLTAPPAHSHTHTLCLLCLLLCLPLPPFLPLFLPLLHTHTHTPTHTHCVCCCVSLSLPSSPFSSLSYTHTQSCYLSEKFVVVLLTLSADQKGGHLQDCPVTNQGWKCSLTL